MENLTDTKTQPVAQGDENFAFAILAAAQMLKEAAQTVEGTQVAFSNADDANAARQTLNEARAALAKLDAAFGA